jgi:hypothetical protein
LDKSAFLLQVEAMNEPVPSPVQRINSDSISVSVEPLAVVLRRAGCSRKNAVFVAALVTLLITSFAFCVWAYDQLHG